MENSVQPFKITSQPYSLEEFHKKHDFPQMACAVGGYFGVRKEDIISVGQEFLLFFVKTSQVIVASNLSCGRPAAQQYYIPLNSSHWFIPYECSRPEGHKSANDSGHYKTVGDLLKRKGELPKVVKVCKTYNGKSALSSVVADKLIFPQKVLKRKKVLECLNNRKEVIQLEFSCEGNFSVRPMDVKMHIVELVQHFNDFPVSVMVISDHAKSNTSFSLSTGTILSLKESKTLQSYIYTTDIFGKKNYPLLEMPMYIPVEIQSIEYARLDMRPIYNAIQHAYENFKPSMVKRKFFSTEHELYEEVQKEDGTTHIYDLEKPSRIYESISGKIKGTKDVNNDPTHRLVKASSSFTDKPPFPPPRPKSLKNPYKNFDFHQPVSSTVTRSTSSAPTSPASATSNMGSSKKSYVVKKSPVLSGDDTAVTTKSCHNKASSVPPTTATAFHSSKEENLAYLKTFSLDNILQLLDNMNLGEHKKSFKDEQIDGEIIVHLDKGELVELGVIKSIHQTRLLKLMDGSISAKKYYQCSN